MQNTNNEYQEFSSYKNFYLAWQRLQRSLHFDVKDWFSLQVYGHPEHIEKHLNRIRNSANQFKPTTPDFIFKPKKDRSLRRFAYRNFEDRLFYQAVGNRLIQHSGNLIRRLSYKRKVFGNIPNKANNPFIFKPAFTKRQIPGQYELFVQDILDTQERLVATNPGSWLIKTDISAFYSSINHEVLEVLLTDLDALPDDTLIEKLFECLERWTHSKSSIGLPVGYETSDHLANLYLLEVDELLQDVEYKRYVDDIYIFVETLDDAKRVTKSLDDVLRELELERKAAKTEFICLNEISSRELREKLTHSLSAIAHKRLDPQAESQRQDELTHLLASSTRDADEYCFCVDERIEDAKAVAFVLNRLDRQIKQALEIAFCILDLRPNYAYHATSYICRNFGNDDEVLDELVRYSYLEHEPTQLRFIILSELASTVGIGDLAEIIKGLLTNNGKNEWYLKYKILILLLQREQSKIANEYLSEITQGENNIFLKAMCVFTEFVSARTESEQIKIVNKAFINIEPFVQHLGIYLSTWVNQNGVKSQLLSDDLREQFFDKNLTENKVECRELFRTLFGVVLHENFLFEKEVESYQEMLPLLRKANSTRLQGARTFADTVQQILLRIFNSYYGDSCTSISQVIDVYGRQDNHLYSLMRLDEMISDEHLKNGLQSAIIANISPIMQKYLSKLHQTQDLEVRDLIFVSYAHADDTDENNKLSWTEQLYKALKSSFRSFNYDLPLFIDKHSLRGGDFFHEEIMKALDKTRIAILLVSDNFFASDYIMNHEYPYIMKQARQKNLTIIWIPVEHSTVNEDSNHELRAIHTPIEIIPLSDPNVDSKKVFAQVAHVVREAIYPNNEKMD